MHVNEFTSHELITLNSCKYSQHNEINFVLRKHLKLEMGTEAGSS
jgi:hypothetical protein